MRAHVFALTIIVALASVTAFAHGPQIQIAVDPATNTIVTRQLLLDEPYSSAVGLTAPASVYVMPALPVSFIGQPVARVKPSNTQVFGPGFTYGYDQTVGSTRRFQANLNLHVNGLQIWDGSAFVPTAANKEQIGLLASSSNVNADAVKTTASGGDIAVSISKDVNTGLTNYTADAHSSMRYTLLGDGLDPYAASRDGVYLLTLQLSGTQSSPALAPSAPFYYIVGKNVPFDSLTNVVNSFTSSQGIGSNLVQYMANVPEPSAAALAALGAVGVFGSLSRRRRRGR